MPIGRHAGCNHNDGENVAVSENKASSRHLRASRCMVRHIPSEKKKRGFAFSVDPYRTIDKEANNP